MIRYQESCLPPVAHIVADLDEIEAEEAVRIALRDPGAPLGGDAAPPRAGSPFTGWRPTPLGLLGGAP